MNDPVAKAIVVCARAISGIESPEDRKAVAQAVMRIYGGLDMDLVPRALGSAPSPPGQADRSADEERRRKDRERKAARKFRGMETGNSAERSSEFRVEFPPPSQTLPSPSEISSPYDSEQSREPKVSVSTAPAPAAARAEAAGTALDFTLSRLLEAYAETVRATARRSYAFPAKMEQRATLLELLDGHALEDGRPLRDAEGREAWLRFTLPTYVKHVLAQERAGGEARKFATMNPTGFLAWLNANPEVLRAPPAESGVMRVAPAALADLASGIGGGR